VASRQRQDRFAHYFLIGAAVFLLVAIGSLVFVFLRARTSPVDQGNDGAAMLRDSLALQSGQPVMEKPSARSSETRPTSVTAPEEKPITLRTDDLRQQYANNEAGADQKYKSKQLEVRGPITMVLQEPPLIGIFFGQAQEPIPAILCEMDRQERGLLAKLQRGQTITVRGTCMGKTQEGFIGLGNCRVVSGAR
jgi:hypothetical protein